MMSSNISETVQITILKLFAYCVFFHAFLASSDFYHSFLASADFFFKITFSKNSFRDTIRVSNNLDPDQARHFVGPHLDPKCLQKLSADATSRQRIKPYRLFFAMIIYIQRHLPGFAPPCSQFI